MLSFPHSLASNNLASETGYIKKSKVQGSSFEVGAKVTYKDRDMIVSEAPNSDGDIMMIDLSGIMALAASLPECGLTSLECAPGPYKCSPLCQRPLTLLLPLSAWATTGSVASTFLSADAAVPIGAKLWVPTLTRASPSCARGSRGAP